MIRTLLLLLMPATLAAAAPNDAPRYYTVEYHAELRPSDAVIATEMRLAGERLPSRIVLHIDPRRHRDFGATDPIEIGKDTVTWRPQGKMSRLHYEFVVDHERAPERYDSLMTKDWAVFRGDKLIPRASVTAPRRLESRASLQFVLPKNWSVATPYAAAGEHRYSIEDPQRRFDRPEGWMLAGKIGTRSEKIAGVYTTVAAPAGDNARRQDALAFLNWNLPRLLEVFPDFPRRLLVVSAGDPMWRGGLSGPASLYLHADRPFISENRTSTMLHELVHVAMGIRADEESDWIVEGLAELYSIETLRRSGGIGERRYAQALADLSKWARRSPGLFLKRSNGPVTARAVLTLKELDREIRQLTQDSKSLDDVARQLAAERGEVTLERLQGIAQKVAGRPVQTLERARLTSPASAPAP